MRKNKTSLSKRLMAGIGLLALLAPNAVYAQTAFDAGSTYEVGPYPFAAAPADFDGDGQLDLAVSNGGSASVSVLLRDTDGTFKAQTTYPVGSDPYDIIARDFNGDGRQDLAVVNASSNSLSILLGYGDGTFTAASNYAVGIRPWSIAASDFNGDGVTDLAVANQISQSVTVLLGRLDGTFAAVSTVAGLSTPWAIAAGDLNGDGNADLIVTQSDSKRLYTLIGDGTGRFTVTANADGAPTGNYSVALGDYDEDGKFDLILASQDGTMSFINGSSLPGGTPVTSYALNANPASVTAADFNGDGHLDAAAAIPQRGIVSIYWGNGSGTLQDKTDLNVGQYPRYVTSGDFNGDGLPDLAAVNSNSFDVTILMSSDMFSPVWPDNATVSATSVTASGVTLSWPAATDNFGTIGYSIFRDSDPDSIANVDGSTTSYTADGLDNDMSYTFTVKAVDAAGNLSAPLTAAITTLKKTPPALTADSTDNETLEAIDLAFADDSNWRAALQSVTVDSDMLDDADYDVAAGKLSIQPSVLQPGSHAITIQAAGYSDASVVQTIKGITALAGPTVLKLKKGKSADAAITASYSDGSTREIAGLDAVTWTVPAPAIVSVDHGKLTGLKTGNAVIQVSYGGRTVDFPVIVSASSTPGESTTAPPVVDPPVVDPPVVDPPAVEQPDPIQEPEPSVFSDIVEPNRILDTLRTAIRSNIGASYTDTAGHWSEASIRTATKLTVISGYGDHSFKPDALITRAEFSKLIVQAFELHMGGGMQTFTDISGNWAETPIRILASNGVIHGYEDGSFHPERSISRAEMAAILVKMFNLEQIKRIGGNDHPVSFSDVKAGNWAKSAIDSLANAGIIEGTDSTHFAPDQGSKRAEATVMIIRALRMDQTIRALIEQAADLSN